MSKIHILSEAELGLVAGSGTTTTTIQTSITSINDATTVYFFAEKTGPNGEVQAQQEVYKEIKGDNFVVFIFEA